MLLSLSGLGVGLVLLLGLSAPGCGSPAPTCAPKGQPYVVCSDDAVWTCPEGDAATVAANQKIDADCMATADPTTCFLQADYQMVDMTLAEDCAAAGKTCVEDVVAKSASCQMK
ncbi:MAG: hypothetical protein U0414_26955 [Polyangiaceae bacterium]